MTDKEPSLLYVGYKCKGNFKSNYKQYVTATNLTDRSQKEFIEWYHKKILPQIDEKLDFLKLLQG